MLHADDDLVYTPLFASIGSPIGPLMPSPTQLHVHLHHHRPFDQLSSSQTYSRRSSEYPSLPSLSTPPDLPDSPIAPTLESEFCQMLSFQSRPTHRSHPSNSTPSFTDTDHHQLADDPEVKCRSGLDPPFVIPSITSEFTQHSSGTVPRSDVEVGASLYENPRSDSDSTTTSNMRHSSIGTCSVHESDLPSHPKTDVLDPTLPLISQSTTEDIFLEQEPICLPDPVPDPSPLDNPDSHCLASPPSDPIVQDDEPHPVIPTNSLPRPVSPCPDPYETNFDAINVLGASARMTEVGMMIQEVALALFEVQELRHSNAFNSDSIKARGQNHIEASPSLIANAKSQYTSQSSSQSRSAGTSALTPVDRALMKLDKKVEETSVEVVHLEELIKPFEGARSDAEVGFLKQKYDTLMSDWVKIQKDTELLRDELKEDKWLVVFRTVSGQAEEMMESLEKVLATSQEYIWDFKKQCRHSDQSRRISEERRRGKSSSEPHLPQLEGLSLVMDPLVVQDLLDRYLMLCKNFSAKKKHYLPSCERVLTTLVKGIENRSTKNGEVLRRYADMRTRFNNIQQRISRIDTELGQAEKLLRQTIELGEEAPTQSSKTIATSSSVQTSVENGKSTTPSSNRTLRAINSVTQYLSPSSSQHHSKHAPTLSSFKKLASKITPTKSRPISPGSAPSHDSTQSNLARSHPAAPNPSHPIQSSSESAPRGLSRARSILQLAESSFSQGNRPATRQHQRSTTTVDLHSQTTPHLSRADSSHTHYRSVPVAKSEKPRWNISLKRMEDREGPPRRALHTPGPGTTRTTSRCPSRFSHTAPNHSSGWTPSSSVVRPAGQQRLGSVPPEGSHGYGYTRPGSAAGRSDCSAFTSVSMSYKPRPPSRNTRIPGPIWDPTISRPSRESQTSNGNRYPYPRPSPLPSRPPSRTSTTPIGTSRLPRPSSRCATPGIGGRSSSKLSTMLTPSSIASPGRFSPTNSDLAKLPKYDSRRCSLPQARGSNGTSIGGGYHQDLGDERIGRKKKYDFNPFDPLDRMVSQIVQDQMIEIGLRRIDPPLSRNAEKVKSSGGGVGDQARYRFKFMINIGSTGTAGDRYEERETKSMMCKLVLRARAHHSINKPDDPRATKVVVRVGGGWQELEMYLLDEQERILRA